MTKFKQNNLKKLVHWPNVSQIISEWLIYSFQQHPNFYNNDPLSVMPDHAGVSDGYRLSTYRADLMPPKFRTVMTNEAWWERYFSLKPSVVPVRNCCWKNECLSSFSLSIFCSLGSCLELDLGAWTWSLWWRFTVWAS